MNTAVLRTKSDLCVYSDYGFERSYTVDDRCFPDFWFDPDSPPEDCHLGQNYKSSTGYVRANNSIVTIKLHKLFFKAEIVTLTKLFLLEVKTPKVTLIKNV